MLKIPKADDDARFFAALQAYDPNRPVIRAREPEKLFDLYDADCDHDPEPDICLGTLEEAREFFRIRAEIGEEATRQLWIDAGRIAKKGPPQRLFDEPEEDNKPVRPARLRRVHVALRRLPLRHATRAPRRQHSARHASGARDDSGGDGDGGGGEPPPHAALTGPGSGRLSGQGGAR
jgi:hypothetical protein